jgi:diguanylate cyclase (GGDEF)-like protein
LAGHPVTEMSTHHQQGVKMKKGSRLSREQLLSCLDFGKALTSELDPNRLLEKIMHKVSRLFPSETWSLLLLDEATETLRFELSIDLDLEQVKEIRLALGQGAAGHCALNQEILVLEGLIETCNAEGVVFSLIFMDIDDFKTVVDTVGHLNGSRTLREVAQQIKGCLEGPSFAVAYGGDEFVVVLPETNSLQAAETARKIRDAIKGTTFLTRWGRKVKVTASFGIATFPDHAGDVKALLALADQAM